MNRKTPSAHSAKSVDEVIAKLREMLKGLRYGKISLKVHESRVVQVDVTETTRP